MSPLDGGVDTRRRAATREPRYETIPHLAKLGDQEEHEPQFDDEEPSWYHNTLRHVTNLASTAAANGPTAWQDYARGIEIISRTAAQFTAPTRKEQLPPDHDYSRFKPQTRAWTIKYANQRAQGRHFSPSTEDVLDRNLSYYGYDPESRMMLPEPASRAIDEAQARQTEAAEARRAKLHGDL